MNPAWLVRNVASFWPVSASPRDFLQCMLWIYSAKLPAGMGKSEREIAFRYRQPIGDVKLLLRANAGSDGFIHGEVFNHHYYRLPLARDPATVLDLGANTGMTAVYFHRVYPQAEIACVEPVPDNLRVLARNLELNGVDATVFAAAADVRDGVARMELMPKDFGHRVAHESNTGATTLEVPALSIPTILARLGWERIGLLKIDVEGHEKALFASDSEWMERVDAMCIECHEGFGEADLRALASRYGFREPVLLPGIWLLDRA